MIHTILEEVKEAILIAQPKYNCGFANVSKPAGKGVVIDEAMNYAGINDQLGNYFYLRSLKETTYIPRRYSARPIWYNANTNCRIVSVFHNVSEDVHRDMLLSIISRQGYNITKAITERTQVWVNEVGNQKISNWLQEVHLCSIDFQVSEIVSMNNCPPEICNCQ